MNPSTPPKPSTLAALCLALMWVLLAPASSLGAFGLTTAADSFTVDTDAGLVFKVRRTDNGSNTQSAGDLMSLVFNGVQYQNQTRGSHINSGFDFLYNGVSAVAVSAAVVNVDYIKVTVVAGDLTHYYLARRGDPHIYMATHFLSEPDTLGLCRYIVRVPANLLPNGPAPSDIRNNTGAIESADIFGMADGTTRSKHYSNMRLKDWSHIGAIGTNVGMWMVRSNHEGDSGGPFYRSLLNQCGTDQEITYIINYGEAQTEPFRTNILNGPYALVFTTGAPPPALDTSWVGNMGLIGYVAPGGRGSVSASAITNRDTRHAYTVGFANATAQYFTDAAAGNGAFTCPGMLPGTYTMRIFKKEIAVYSASVTVTAGATTALGNIAIADDPSRAVPRWRIGNWDGTPAEFLNGDKVTTMHPSDVRMAGWNPGTFVIGTSAPAVGMPAYQWKDVNGSQAIQFELTPAQLVASTVRVGITCAFEGARPKIAVNAWNSANPAPSTQPDTRTLTVGTYRGNNTTFAFAVPASAFVAGTNTLWITPISGSGATGFLSAGYSLDCIEFYQGAAQTLAIPGAPASVNATGGNGQATLTWSATAGAASYAIQRAATTGGPYIEIATGLTGTSLTDTGLRNGATYFYVVNATNTSGTGVNSAPASATPFAPELRAHLRFDETSGTTAADATGNGWNGALVNGPAFAAGRINNAVNLDGVNDHIALPAGLLVGLGDFTISAWVKVNTVTNWARVFDCGTGTGAYLFLTPKNGVTNTVRFAISAGGIGGEQTIDGAAALPAGVWTHVAVSLSGNAGTLYVNGAVAGTNSAMTAAPFNLGNTTQNYLGKSQFAADPHLHGSIDDFRIRGRALTSTEIAALASPPLAPTGLVATAGNAQVALTWSAVSGAASYTVKRSTTSGSGFAAIASALPGTTFTDSAVTNGTIYFYVIAAANLAGEGPHSASASTRPIAPISAEELRAPALVVANGTATITAQASVVGHSYQLQYRDNLASGAWLPIGSAQSGSGSALQFTAAVAAGIPQRFYQLAIQP